MVRNKQRGAYVIAITCQLKLQFQYTVAETRFWREVGCH
jgi:hypothetical protein